MAPTISATDRRDSVDRFLQRLEGIPGLDYEVEAIVERIIKLQRRIRRDHDETLAEHGLTYGEWSVLGSLIHGECNSPGELSTELEVSTGAMTNRLDRLEEAGLVRRIPNADDRRGVLIEITDEGRQVWRESVGAQAKKEALITKAALDQHEREELNTYLRRLMIAFEETDPPGWSKH